MMMVLKSRRSTCAICTRRMPMCLSRLARARTRSGSWASRRITRAKKTLRSSWPTIARMRKPRSSMSYPTLQVFYSTGGPISWSPGIGLPAQGDGYLGWFKYILDLPYIPPTISISYGNPEPSLPLAYAVALCNLFVQLGLRGVRVLVGSGDDGIGPKDCENSSGNVQFNPTFP